MEETNKDFDKFYTAAIQSTQPINQIHHQNTEEDNRGQRLISPNGDVNKVIKTQSSAESQTLRIELKWEQARASLITI